MTEKILLSTDIGSDIDDALALMTMLNSKINLKAIYTVNGDIIARSFIAKHMIDLSGRNIDVAAGESESLNSLVKPYTFFESCYVADEFIDDEETEIFNDIRFKKIENAGIIPNGVEDLAERLSKEKYIIFSIAPLTNIAGLLQDYPDSAKNIERVYVMGCRFSSKGNLEHNVLHDPLAAKLVFESDLPLTIIPGDLCEKYRMPADMIANFKTPAGRYVRQMALGFIGVKTVREYVSRNLDEDGAEQILKSPELETHHSSLSQISPLPKDFSFTEVSESSVFRYLKQLFFKLKNVNVRDFLEKHVKTSSFEGKSKQEIEELLEAKSRLMTNLDSCDEAVYKPEDYFRQYHALIEHIRSPELKYSFGSIVADMLESFIPKDLSVADAYIPYCFLHPE
ncbi:nucleoside hydrolase, partial [Candidatus Woesearchaeota archaeon]|nr:nucleoside hydrolase [Candidatus Woesearchaeota archaeon]